MEAFLQTSAIPHSTPASDNFAFLQKSYSGVHQDKQPSVVVLPETPQQVSDTVKQALAHGLPIVVRGGGHDSFGRWTVADAVLLDLRNLNYVTVDAQSKTARVAGGATLLKVLEVLKDHGFQSATGACGTVGYTGWALAGGMGLLMHSYGVGADQIVGAKVVNAKGDLVNASDRLLKGLRGGGGSLAIVVELIIKIHPLNEIQSGMLLFESSDIRASMATFFTNFAALLDQHQQKLPSKLGLIPGIFAIPGLGLTVGSLVMWNGPADDESNEWISRIAKLSTLSPATPDPKAVVTGSSVHEFIAHINTLLPATVTGRCQTATVSGFTPQVIANLAESAAEIPAGFTGGINMHILRGDSPSCSDNVPDSVLPYRKPQIILELLGFAQDDEASKAAAEWARVARNRFFHSEDSLRGTYLPLTAPEFLDLEETYGDNWAELNKIKSEVDPEGVFKHTIPALI